MKWKSSKTQPNITNNNDVIVIIDILGNIYFDLKIEGRGKNSKIGNKKWEDIKEYVAFWQYQPIIEEYFKKKLKFTFEKSNGGVSSLLFK